MVFLREGEAMVQESILNNSDVCKRLCERVTEENRGTDTVAGFVKGSEWRDGGGKQRNVEQSYP